MGKYIVELEGGTHMFVLGPEGIVHIGEPDVVYETVDGMQIGDAVINAKPYTEPDLDAIRTEEYEKGVQDTKQHWIDAPRTCAYKLGYENGLNDLWEAMQKAIKMYCEIDNEVYLRVFYDVKCDWGESVLQALFKNTPQHLIDSIRKYEQRQEEQIRVGDEVITASGKAVVMGVGPVHFEYVYEDGSSGYDEVKNVKKTGRHFPEIAEVLQKIGG